MWSGRPKPDSAAGTPPEAGTRLERRPVAVEEHPTGHGRVEAYTVLHDHENEPALGIVVGRTDTGLRFVANLPDDREVLRSFTVDEGVGRTGSLRSCDDGRNEFKPD